MFFFNLLDHLSVLFGGFDRDLICSISSMEKEYIACIQSLLKIPPDRFLELGLEYCVQVDTSSQIYLKETARSI